MAPASSRKITSKPVLTRRTTKGPLQGEEEDLLSNSNDSSRLPQPPPTPSPLSHSPEPSRPSTHDATETPSQEPAAEETFNKDLSFLLESGIYHPVGQIDIPPPFRRALPPPPLPGSSSRDVVANLEQLLAECHFLGAAHLCALTLTSGIVRPTDHNTIFKLLAIRYSSLELSGNILLAAQEAKALEDLSSTFYYVEEESPASVSQNLPAEERALPRHIMPFDLRIQAVRLQSIGFSDARRGVSALYDLGLECRDYIASPLTTPEDLLIWQQRLEIIGVRVVNALIENGDLDCAARTLDSISVDAANKDGHSIARLVLLAVKMGDVSRAKDLMTTNSLTKQEEAILNSILDVAGGNFEDAVRNLSRHTTQSQNSDLEVIARQNLAVAYLYAGQLSNCRATLEHLVEEKEGFQALITNLATVYELCSDKAHNLKMGLAEKLVATGPTSQHGMYTNADFKL